MDQNRIYYRLPRTLRSRSSRAVLGKDLLLDSPETEENRVQIIRNYTK